MIYGLSWSLSVRMLSVPLFTMKHVTKPRAKYEQNRLRVLGLLSA